MTDANHDLRVEELQRFSQNASRLLLEQGRLPEFLAELDYLVQPKSPNEMRGPCPVCRTSYCIIGTRGRIHLIYWKCYNRECDSNTGKAKAHHNLLGLVRAIVEDGKLGTAIKVIAKFLGYEGRSFDVTNGKFMGQRTVPNGENDKGRHPPESPEAMHSPAERAAMFPANSPYGHGGSVRSARPAQHD